jgi:hypothetical protein
MPTKSNTEPQYQFLVRTIAEHKTDECLLWPFHVCKRWGYSYVSVPGEPGSAKRIHRVAYKLLHGHYPLHDGCHTCDNRHCYNPRHIVDGTDVQNFGDMIAKGRSARGEKNNQAVITEAMVIDARRSHAEGESTQALAKRLGMSFGGMKKVLNGQSWHHVTFGLTPAQISRRPRRKSHPCRLEYSGSSSLKLGDQDRRST